LDDHVVHTVHVELDLGTRVATERQTESQTGPKKENGAGARGTNTIKPVAETELSLRKIVALDGAVHLGKVQPDAAQLVT
jgi:hypothetical protein